MSDQTRNPDPSCSPSQEASEAQQRRNSRLYGNRTEAYVHGLPAWDPSLKDFDVLSDLVAVASVAGVWQTVASFQCPHGSIGWLFGWGYGVEDENAIQAVQWRVTVNDGVVAGPFPATAQVATIMTLSQMHTPLPQGFTVRAQALNSSGTSYNVVARLKGVTHRETGERV